MSYRYKMAILGGTFDHLHLGHKTLISAALDQSERVTIGIVETAFSTDKSFASNIEVYATREAKLKSYLGELDVIERTTIIPIRDIYGTSLTDSSIEAIFVTDSTSKNAEVINIERQKLGLPKLAVVIVPYALGSDGKIISSGRIRAGEINREGLSYLQFFLQKQSYCLPDHLRPVLQIPLGTVVSQVKDLDKLFPTSPRIISVGDIVSLDLKQSTYIPCICIIDFHTRRHEIDKEIIEKYFPVVHKKITNPPGTINSEIAETLLLSIAANDQTKKTQIIAVEGEEDLLTLPAILLSPLDTYVIYGQYKVGMVVVKVTEEIKLLAKNYLEQF